MVSGKFKYLPDTLGTDFSAVIQEFGIREKRF
jgi:hypothetical protein